jgi:hypothetical protein
MATKKKKGELSARTKEIIAQMAVKQIGTGFKFKQPRMEEVLMSEDLYYGQSMPRLRGRFSVPLPTMGGYIDTLLSKTDEDAQIGYSSKDKADYKATKGAKGIAGKVLGDRKMRWNGKNRNQKKMAAFSGVGIGELFTESVPEYRNRYRVVDHLDFYADSTGGEDVQEHDHCGVANLFRSTHDLESNAASGFYDAAQVQKLLSSANDEQKKKNSDLYRNKVDRFRRMGLDLEGNDYAGESMWSLCWSGVTYKGKRYLVTLDYVTGTWVRCVPVEEVTGDKEMWPWHAWHTHPDENNFWSKAPADDIRPVAIAIDIMFNQALDNRQKRNFGMRAFDSSIFPNPEELEWRPDGLIEGTPAGMKSLQQGIYEFKTEEIGGTVDLIEFMDGYLGTKTGITAGAQGESEQDKVGIYYGDMQQVADRLGLYNKSYSDYYEEIGVCLLYGMRDHLDEETAGKMLGVDGPELANDIIERITPEWDIEVTGSQAEIRASEMRKERRMLTLREVVNHPALGMRVNPDWAISEMLRSAEWDDDDIEKALDLSATQDAEQVGEAEKAMQELMNEKQPPIYRAATTAFVKHIVNKATLTKFADDPAEDIAIFERIMAYAQQHVPIASENMIVLGRELSRQQRLAQATNAEPTLGGTGTPGETPPPGNTAAGTASRSQKLPGVDMAL